MDYFYTLYFELIVIINHELLRRCDYYLEWFLIKMLNIIMYNITILI